MKSERVHRSSRGVHNQRPVLLRWEGTGGHPRQLLDRLRSLLEDSDYLVEETYEESESRLRDSMTFEARLVCWRYED